MQAQQKLRPALQCQAEHEKFISRLIIPRETDNRPICLWGFIGNVKEFRSCLKAQRKYLIAGIIAP